MRYFETNRVAKRRVLGESHNLTMKDRYMTSIPLYIIGEIEMDENFDKPNFNTRNQYIVSSYIFIS